MSETKYWLPLWQGQDNIGIDFGRDFNRRQIVTHCEYCDGGMFAWEVKAYRNYCKYCANLSQEQREYLKYLGEIERVE